MERYLIRKILPAWPQREARLWNVILYRWFNRISTYEILTPWHAPAAWDPKRALQALRRQMKSEAVFSGAYQFTTAGKKCDKVGLYVGWLDEIHKVLPDLWANLQKAPTMAEAHKVFRVLSGVGGFVAYERIIDACYPEGGGPLLPFTEDDWAHIGPGAMRGLALLWNGELPKPKMTLDLLRELQKDQAQAFLRAGVRLEGPPLTLRNVEHVCCEYSKYRRATEGGRSKRTYAPARANEDLSPWDDLPSRFRTSQGR